MKLITNQNLIIALAILSMISSGVKTMKKNTETPEPNTLAPSDTTVTKENNQTGEKVISEVKPDGNPLDAVNTWLNIPRSPLPMILLA
jgi:hypothetical protein